MKRSPYTPVISDLSFAEVLSKIKDALKTEFQKIVPRPWRDVAAAVRGRRVSAVYLIYAPDGELLYVGKSDNIGHRLSSHRKPGGILFDNLLSQAGFPLSAPMGHRCDCGKVLPCDSGNLKIDDTHAGTIERLKKTIVDTFLVGLIHHGVKQGLNGSLPVGLKEIETLAQFLLSPKFGWIRDCNPYGLSRIQDYVKEVEKDSFLEQKQKS